MIVEFQDLEDRVSPYNGSQYSDAAKVVELLESIAMSRPPSMCEIIGDNGVTLTVGVGGKIGCAQFAASNGMPPYLMAVNTSDKVVDAGALEFCVGGTATPIEHRYCIPIRMVKLIVIVFVESGNRGVAQTSLWMSG